MHGYGACSSVRILADEAEAHRTHAVRACEREARAVQLPEKVLAFAVAALEVWNEIWW